MKKPKSPSAKPESKVKAEPKAKQSVATAVTQAKPQQPSPKKTALKKAPAIAPQPAAEALPELSVLERVGLTAGSIWHYLSENGVENSAIKPIFYH